MRKRLLLMSVILLISFPIFSQMNYKPGFIITLEGDSILGEIENRGSIKNSVICTFKQEESEKWIDYGPSEISAYGFKNGKFYVSRDIELNGDTLNVFLEYLIDGIVDAYFYRDENEDYYFVEKEGVDLILLDDNQKIILFGQ